MASLSAQLLVFLKYIGTLGSGACVEQLGQSFNVSSSVCFGCIERTSRAILSLYNDVVYWPSVDSHAIPEPVLAKKSDAV